MRSTKCSPTTSSCFQRHQWAKSEGLFPSPLVPVLGAACEVMWWTGMWWSVVPPYIWVFFHEWDYKKTTENGASQFPSHSKELKATTGIRCLCVCVSLSVCEYLDHSLGFWELIGKVVNGVSSRTEQWDPVGIFTLKGTLFFPKRGWGRWNSPAWRGSTLEGRGFPEERSEALQGLACQEAAAAAFTRMPPTTTRWLCVSFLRGCLFKALIYFDFFQRELYQETSRENHLAIILFLTLISVKQFLNEKTKSHLSKPRTYIWHPSEPRFKLLRLLSKSGTTWHLHGASHSEYALQLLNEHTFS